MANSGNRTARRFCSPSRRSPLPETLSSLFRIGDARLISIPASPTVSSSYQRGTTRKVARPDASREDSRTILITRTAASREWLWSITDAHKTYGASPNSSRGDITTSQKPIGLTMGQSHRLVGVQDSKKQNAAKTQHDGDAQEPCNQAPTSGLNRSCSARCAGARILSHR